MRGTKGNPLRELQCAPEPLLLVKRLIEHAVRRMTPFPGVGTGSLKSPYMGG
jgi:hypothetical protein